MDQISAIAASGFRARMESLDLLANNMANSSTSGYKGDGEFYSVYSSEASDADASGSPTALPMVQRQYTDFAQGLIENTNNPTDLAISGKGLFVVKGPTEPLYTRNGSFHVSPGGTVSTTEGYSLLLQGGKELKVDTTKPFAVSPDGTVRQDGEVLGQLQLAEFKDRSAILKQGFNYFRNVSDEPPTQAADAQVQQGKLEASNVNAAHGAVRLVGVMRQFEVMQKAISISNDMSRQAIEQVAKV
jgi:flagellar basal body rod protein FlgG